LVDVPQRVAEHRAALFDRLLHHTLIAQISGESYRLKEQA
jgi:DNA replication protein DnaC